MVKIHVPGDCDNAPKKLFVKDFIVAIIKNDTGFMDKNTTADIQWNIVGGQHTDGKEAVLDALRQARTEAVAALTIHTIVTHGYEGVAEGELQFKDGKRLSFCDIYRFKSSVNNAPVKAITTYAIGLPKK